MRTSLLCRSFALAALVVLALQSIAWGQIFLIDVDNTGANPTLGGTWNVIPAPGTFALVDTTGAASSVNIIIGSGWTDGATDQGIWPSGNNQWVDGNATRDFFLFTGLGGVSQTITFSGLSAGTNYRVDYVAARATGGFGTSDYTIFGNFADTTPNGDNFDANVNGWLPGNILRWNSVTPNGSNQIVVTVTENGFLEFGYATALRLEALSAAIPEPTSLALIAVGGVCIWSRRRRRRQVAIE